MTDAMTDADRSEAFDESKERAAPIGRTVRRKQSYREPDDFTTDVPVPGKRAAEHASAQEPDRPRRRGAGIVG